MGMPTPPKIKRKNPILRTRQMNLPPSGRSRIALGMTAGAALGQLRLQTCADCGAVQYPAREACVSCLSIRLPWRTQAGQGMLLSQTVLSHSNDLFYRERLPWRLGMVQLQTQGKPVLICHLHQQVQVGPVRVIARLDKAGQAVLIAVPIAVPLDSKEQQELPALRDGELDMASDPQLREMICDPKNRKVLVTDGKSALGQAMVKAFVQAGAEIVWAGQAEPWKQFPGMKALSELSQVSWVPLDVTDQRSVNELAGEIAGKVDMVVNTAEVHRSFGISARAGTEVAKAEMEVNYFGLLRLAQAFGPALKGRSADGVNSACAWVNMLSIYALANFPAHGTYSASKAAAFSLAQCLRAEMQGSGIRVLNVFPGPIEDEWNQNMPPPKLAPNALANAVVRALRDGLEDLYPGDVAQEWLARYRDDPKVLERELAQ